MSSSRRPPTASLSSGTMGLKFMQRAAAAQGKAAAPDAAETKGKAKAAEISEWVIEGADVGAGQVEEQGRFTYEQSYISFLMPALAGDEPSSSFPVAGGRRSFGGANKDIERLANPPPPSTSEPPAQPAEPSSSRGGLRRGISDSGRPSKSKRPSNPASRERSVSPPRTQPQGWLKPAGFDHAAPAKKERGWERKKRERDEAGLVVDEEEDEYDVLEVLGANEVKGNWEGGDEGKGSEKKKRKKKRKPVDA